MAGRLSNVTVSCTNSFQTTDGQLAEKILFYLAIRIEFRESA